ncbi:MAG: 50S ribosomal protein L3 [Tissierellales bacterium]|jgi:large subunit ribosomal protein L3|nr:50S ribosomal protein L3 [Tissierellales bacterium]HCX03866.1 50S ribosomal protein L3 [Clostridiales bacterium]
MKGIIGKKLGMTQVFKEDGTLVPVTVVESQGMKVVQIKTEGKEGYNSLQIGFGDIKDKNVNKPKKGHFSKAQVENKRMLKEFRIDNPEEFEIGQEIKVDIFEEGEIVDVEGTSKGKGFQGNIKRHNQSRGPETHGSKYHRAVGSMGASAHPARVFKTKKLPGHMGHEKVTVKNLEIVKVDLEKNLLLIKGAVPGPKKGTVIVRKK